MHVLLVDDDDEFRTLTRSALEGRGHHIDECNDGADALDRLQAGGQVDIVVLDAQMPNATGIEVCQIMRGRGDRTPVLILTSHEDEASEVAFLQAGADDFVAKSRGHEVLALRIDRTVATANADPADDARRGPSTALRVGPVEIDAAAERVTVAGTQVSVRPKELLVLDILARNVGSYVSTDTLARALAGLRGFPSHAAATKQIQRVREALRGTAAEHMVTRRAGSGYQLDPSLAAQDDGHTIDRGRP
jgi:DNA-binding response OmpR family regulator